MNLGSQKENLQQKEHPEQDPFQIRVDQPSHPRPPFVQTLIQAENGKYEIYSQTYQSMSCKDQKTSTYSNVRDEPMLAFTLDVEK